MQQDVRYVHLRDGSGNLRATVSYGRPDERGVVPYAVVVVSPSEPQHNISLQKARAKAAARLTEVTAAVQEWPGGIQWRPYRGSRHDGIEPYHTHGEHSPYEFIIAGGLYKLGYEHVDTLKDRIKQVREQIATIC